MDGVRPDVGDFRCGDLALQPMSEPREKRPGTVGVPFVPEQLTLGRLAVAFCSSAALLLKPCSVRHIMSQPPG